MNTEQTTEPHAVDAHAAHLRRVAQSPEALVNYLAELQRRVTSMSHDLRIVTEEQRATCRDRHVEGDRPWDARFRSRPVERPLNGALGDLGGAIKKLEKAAFARRTFEDQVKALPAARRDKALAKARKKNPELTAVQNSPVQQVPVSRPMSYGGPTSIYDLNRESA